MALNDNLDDKVSAQSLACSQADFERNVSGSGNFKLCLVDKHFLSALLSECHGYSSSSWFGLAGLDSGLGARPHPKRNQ